MMQGLNIDVQKTAAMHLLPQNERLAALLKSAQMRSSWHLHFLATDPIYSALHDFAKAYQLCEQEAATFISLAYAGSLHDELRESLFESLSRLPSKGVENGL